LTRSRFHRQLPWGCHIYRRLEEARRDRDGAISERDELLGALESVTKELDDLRARIPTPVNPELFGRGLRFHIPLIEPDRRIYRIRLSDETSRLHARRAATKLGQAYKPEVLVKMREEIGSVELTPSNRTRGGLGKEVFSG
jgi:hypothetical protein